MYFPISKLSAESGLLSLEDFIALPDQKDDTYSSACLYHDHNGYLTNLAYSETE